MLAILVLPLTASVVAVDAASAALRVALASPRFASFELDA